jgi:hypothetical protein
MRKLADLFADMKYAWIESMREVMRGEGYFKY